MLSDMAVWVLGRIADTPSYDVARGFVVVASNETRAREIASKEAGDEGAGYWLDRHKSYCKTVDLTTPRIVLCDFRHG